MMKVVVVGGGWSGCAAAACANRNGAEVTLLERTDMLLGTGLVGGIMKNNGRYTATEEMMAMGGGEIFEIVDQNLRHENINFPGHEHASLYDIGKTPGAVMRHLESIGVNIVFESRVVDVTMEGSFISEIKDSNENRYIADVFIDTTGTAGPMNNCTKYGNGCAMCILRCPSFGGRVSLTGLTGVKEYVGKKADGTVGAMSGSCKLYKESLSNKIINKLNKEGVVIIPLPDELIEDHLDIKSCQQYALKEFKHNIILLDTGHAKLMTPYYNLEKLRKIPGFENARYEDPYAGGKGNSMRYIAMAHRDNSLKVEEIENLFCAGEKSGLLVGHTEAIVTGVLAGYNSTKYCKKENLLELSRETVIGEAIAYVREQMKTENGLSMKYTFSGSVFFDRMKELGLYTTDISEIEKRIESVNLKGIFSGK